MKKLTYKELIQYGSKNVKELTVIDAHGQRIYEELFNEGLKVLIFGGDCDACDDLILEENCFPKSLTSLEFSEVFNQPLIDRNILHDNIKTIKFGWAFNQSLDGYWLPKYLEHLEFGTCFQYPIKAEHLPLSLNRLILDEFDYKGEIDCNIPDKLKRVFHFNSYKNSMPIQHRIDNNVMILIFDDDFNQDIKVSDQLSHNIISIKFGNSFNGDIEPFSLPPNLQSIEFGNGHNTEIFTPGILPSKLQTLKFGEGFVETIPEESLPKSITSLDLGSCYEGCLKVLNHLPLLKTLKLNDYFDKPIEIGFIPNTVTSLSLGYYSYQPISIGALPQGLTSLSINPKFNQDLSIDGILPNSIKVINVHHENEQFLKTNLKLNKFIKLYK